MTQALLKKWFNEEPKYFKYGSVIYLIIGLLLFLSKIFLHWPWIVLVFALISLMLSAYLYFHYKTLMVKRMASDLFKGLNLELEFEEDDD